MGRARGSGTDAVAFESETLGRGSVTVPPIGSAVLPSGSDRAKLCNGRGGPGKGTDAQTDAAAGFGNAGAGQAGAALAAVLPVVSAAEEGATGELGREGALAITSTGSVIVIIGGMM